MESVNFETLRRFISGMLRFCVISSLHLTTVLNIKLQSLRKAHLIKDQHKK